MLITFDPVKNERNVEERGLSFERVAELEWDTGRRHETRLRRDEGESGGPAWHAPAHRGDHNARRRRSRHQLPQGEQDGEKAI